MSAKAAIRSARAGSLAERADLLPDDRLLIVAAHARGDGGVDREHDEERERPDREEPPEPRGEPARRRRRFFAPRGEQRLQKEDRSRYTAENFVVSASPRQAAARIRRRGCGSPAGRVPGEHRREKRERRAEVRVDDSGVREQVGIEGEKGRGEERRHGPVARRPAKIDEQQQRRQHREKRGPRDREDPIGGHAVSIEEVGAVLDERGFPSGSSRAAARVAEPPARGPRGPS